MKGEKKTNTEYPPASPCSHGGQVEQGISNDEGKEKALSRLFIRRQPQKGENTNYKREY
jgi:hypothetical protein